MKFGPLPLVDAEGAVLAHSVRAGGILKKGTVLGPDDLSRLADAGVAEVTVARPDPGDLSEDEAARRIADCLSGEGLKQGRAATGRANILATGAGLVRVDASSVAAANAIDEGVTLATLSDHARVSRGQLLATVKIIPYFVPGAVVDEVATTLGQGALKLLPFRGGRVRLVMTRTSDFKDSLLKKGEAIVRARVEGIGYTLEDVVVVPHETEAVADALAVDADLVLILGASATSDRRDVAPAGVIAAGGQVTRFGMPVDPGNLLFMGLVNKTPIVGLPGCARSPALNGADWVLERLGAGLDVSDADIAAMGVGGLLKEMPDRPHPRESI
ncbi:MAG: molybdopterin-binding protein [Silicimonas sp.]|nr:molybdopterin-binding protein [Silicimonas sp.]